MKGGATMAVYREFVVVEEYGTKDPQEVYRNVMNILLASYAKRHPLPPKKKGDEKQCLPEQP